VKSEKKLNKFIQAGQKILFLAQSFDGKDKSELDNIASKLIAVDTNPSQDEISKIIYTLCLVKLPEDKLPSLQQIIACLLVQ